jgi:hypothetical protein
VVGSRRSNSSWMGLAQCCQAIPISLDRSCLDLLRITRALRDFGGLLGDHKNNKQLAISIAGVGFFALAVVLEYFAYEYEGQKETLEEQRVSSSIEAATIAINQHLVILDAALAKGTTVDPQLANIIEGLEAQRSTIQKVSQVHVNIISAHELALPESVDTRMWLVYNGGQLLKSPVNDLIWVEIVNGTDADIVINEVSARAQRVVGAWDQLHLTDPDWGAFTWAMKSKQQS